LEWYLKHIILQKHKHFEQGIIVDMKEGCVEIDGLLLKNNSIVSFGCKAKKPKEKASFNDVANVLKLLDFSDRVYPVVTTRIKPNDRNRLMNMGKDKLHLIEGQDIERELKSV